MHRPIVLAMLLALVILCGCAATDLSSVWTDPALAASGPLKKVLVCSLARDEALRRISEDAFVKGLPKGVEGMTAHATIPDDELGDVEKVKARLKSLGADGAVVYRLVGVEKQTTYVPPTTSVTPYYMSPYYGGFGPYWGYSYSAVYQPGYLVEDKIVQIECNTYSVANEKLIWTGRSETLNPSSAQQVIDEVVLITIRQMRQDKVLP